MLNPSTADEMQDDPTVRKCRGFSERAGAGSLVVVNLVPWRATEPRALFKAYADGHDVWALDENRKAVAWACAQGTCVAAWGVHFKPWMQPARDLLPLELRCLGRTSSGQPRHPLMVPYSQALEAFR